MIDWSEHRHEFLQTNDSLTYVGQCGRNCGRPPSDPIHAGSWAHCRNHMVFSEDCADCEARMREAGYDIPKLPMVDVSHLYDSPDVDTRKVKGHYVALELTKGQVGELLKRGRINISRAGVSVDIHLTDASRLLDAAKHVLREFDPYAPDSHVTEDPDALDELRWAVYGFDTKNKDAVNARRRLLGKEPL